MTVGEHIAVQWWHQGFRREADWRQVSTEQPWLYAPWAVVGQSGGEGATRSRWTSYEVYYQGRLIATRSTLREAKAWASQSATVPLVWTTETIEVPAIVTNLWGETKEFSGPTRWWAGQ
jgi:hypothetical protein